MQKQILINARGHEARIALLEDDALAEVEYESRSTDALVGNIYKGVARDVLSGLAAFIDVGLGEGHNLFLSSKEVNGAMLKKNGIRRSDHFPIQRAIRQGQQLIVQLKRGGIGDKNAQGTTKISLAGRYWIFMPKDNRMGISRRIPALKERDRLKRIARELKRPEEGLIARTAAGGASEDQLERDFKYLFGTWKGVEEASVKAKAPALLYKGPGFIEAYLRDRLMDDVDRIVIDAKTVYEEVVEYLDYLHLGEFKDRLELYRKRTPLFETYQVEQMIEQSLSRSVALPGGGNIVIEETEALVAIDVNTGSNTRFKGQGDAIFNTNMAAAMEIPKQLRLRKISGIIIVDFVDMVNRDHQRKLLAALQRELKKDRVPTDFVDMTQLGLVEITRKRKGESLADMLSEDEDEPVAAPVPPIYRGPPPEASTAGVASPNGRRKATAAKAAKPKSSTDTTEKPDAPLSTSRAAAVAKQGEDELPAQAKRKPRPPKRRREKPKASAKTAQVQAAPPEAKAESKPKHRRKPSAKNNVKKPVAQANQENATQDAPPAQKKSSKAPSKRRRKPSQSDRAGNASGAKKPTEEAEKPATSASGGKPRRARRRHSGKKSGADQAS